MAEANIRYVEKVVTEKVADGVILELSSEEAKFVADVMSLVGGRFDTRRKFASNISEALYDAGVGSTMVTDLDKSIGIVNRIYFA